MFVDKVLKKIPREIYIYILWGIVVGAVNLGSAWIFMYKCGIEPVRANFLAWILYNFVSFITNRKSVFHTVAETAWEFIKELVSFYVSRVFTLVVEEGLIYILVDRLHLWAMGIKTFTSVLVIFLNYYISKKFICINANVYRNFIEKHGHNYFQTFDSWSIIEWLNMYKKQNK